MLDLKNLSKGSIFTQAYIFFKLKKALEETFEEHYPNLLTTLKISRINILQKKNQFVLVICSQNLGFLTWLKTTDIKILLLEKLKKESFWEKQKSELKLEFKILKS